MDFWALKTIGILCLICIIIFIELLTEYDCPWFPNEMEMVRSSCPLNAIIHMVVGQELK